MPKEPPESAPRLGMDTATATLSLALWWPQSQRVERHQVALGRNLGGRLSSDIDTFLHAHHVDRRDLGGIGVGVGPGSFTGARIGVAWALAVGRALGIPVVGGDSLAALATAVLEPDSRGWVGISTRRQQARVGHFYRTTAGDVVALAPTIELRLGDEPSHRQGSEPLIIDEVPDALHHAKAVDAGAALAPAVRYGEAEPA
jgi:tRNA threonylcarbamoyl adenosine modification protein YeaZ